MNQTAELVIEWAKFEEEHPGAGIDDFCRYRLINKREEGNEEPLFLGIIPRKPEIMLIKMLARIARMFEIYADPAMRELGLRHLADFVFLNAIFHLKTPRKTEVIYSTMTETSTGLLTLTHLKNLGLIEEFDDISDKRSKRLKITVKGTELLFKCYQKIGKLSDMMFGEMPIDDVNLCLNLLKNIEIKYSRLWQAHRGMPLDEVIAMMGREDG